MRDLSRDSTHLYVKEFTQTFLDNVVIESAQDITRRWHRPTRRLETPLISKDRPWEHVPYFTYSNYCVLRDPQDGLFKCWYEDMAGTPAPEPIPNNPFGTFSRQLYAESEDGIHWQKPELDVYELYGHKTNIVLGDSEFGQVHSMNVVLDPHPSRPEERFRALFSHMRNDDVASFHNIRCARSPDGIHWTVYDELPSIGMLGSKLDDVSALFYDEYAREFVQNTRHVMMVAAGAINMRNPQNRRSFSITNEPHNFASYSQRRIFQCRSPDFLHWSEPVLVAAADDEEDNLDDSFYGMSQYKMGNVHLATVGVFQAVDNEMEVQLLMSRDGLRWLRTGKRQPFLAPRGEGYWDAYMVSLVSPPIEMGDELWFYHGGTNYHHDFFLAGARESLDHPEARDPLNARFGLGLATLRKDGYAGLYANRYREGTVVTRPLISLGTKLVINARCAPGGSVQVEVADRYDEALEPCLKERCDPFTGDNVAHTVTWAGNPDIPAGVGSRWGGPGERTYWRKLRFFLRDAELYSFHFEDPVES